MFTASRRLNSSKQVIGSSILSGRSFSRLALRPRGYAPLALVGRSPRCFCILTPELSSLGASQRLTRPSETVEETQNGARVFDGVGEEGVLSLALDFCAK